MADSETLAREWSLADDPDTTVCPFRAAAKLHDAADIFFKPGEAHVRASGLGGNWVVTRYALQEEILLDPARFSSHLSIGFSKLAGDDWPLVPLELDPPEHADYRKVMAPWFTPGKAKQLSGEIRALAVQLLGNLRARVSCDFMTDFAQPYPVTVFLLMMGLPVEQMPTFLAWEEDLLRGSTMAERSAAASSIKAYLLDVIEARRRTPGDDMVSYLLAYRLNDAPLPADRLLGLCFMLFAGGLDTVASTMGFMFRELALRPELQAQLRADPSLIPAATDEFVRAFGVVTTFRYATCDMDFHGAAIRKGDLVELPLGLASRDPAMHADPHTIDFSRKSKRTLSFSTGPHTCAGMHLARIEIRIALEEWLNHMPAWRLADPAGIVTATESVWTLHHLPLAWD